ncbi:MAG: phage virion morphogenesis protein [Alphaproteobacteria bacterium]|nr:phage virion morphogenesis protein [Alphaproteobacteria bacterium]
MTGFAFSLSRPITALAAQASHTAEVANDPRLIEEIAAVFESEARDRIGSTKQDPRGKAWQPWTQRTADKRHSGQSLLLATGHLLDSITAQVRGKTVTVGSTRAYAAVHQFGHGNVPARPFVGLGRPEQTAIDDIIASFVGGASQ